MTIEILYLTTQIQRWVNARVARHLAEQTARLTPEGGTTMTTRPIASGSLGADEPRGSASGLGCMAMSAFYGPADAAGNIAAVNAVRETGCGKPTVHA
jgi:hypothetical protein